MERILALTIDAAGCEAEAWLNGIAIVRVDAARPRATLPVHEYTLAGNNRLELVIDPRPAASKHADDAMPLPKVSDGKTSAHLRVLLPRAGNSVDEGTARVLAELQWGPPAGHPYQVPHTQSQVVALPVNFPRWRWMDAPVVNITPLLQQQAARVLRQLTQEISRGETAGFINAVRLRSEELAAAYQMPSQEVVAMLREYLAGLSSSGPLYWAALPNEGPVLRKMAGGRLLECLDTTGEPALRTAPDGAGTVHVFPMRFAAVEGKLYVLR